MHRVRKLQPPLRPTIIITTTTTTTTTTVLTAIFQVNLGEPVPLGFFHKFRKRNFEDTCHRCINGPDVTPVTQPTLSKRYENCSYENCSCVN